MELCPAIPFHGSASRSGEQLVQDSVLPGLIRGCYHSEARGITSVQLPLAYATVLEQVRTSGPMLVVILPTLS